MSGENAFKLTDVPIQPQELESALEHSECGAVVTFVGRVRDKNLGREVIRLEYEGAPPIAASEFAAIEADARAKFDVMALRCVHRTGTLAIGDIAVWIGVAAPHRAAAFDACRYLIDELKERLPIWKKEHYQDGDSGWINSP